MAGLSYLMGVGMSPVRISLASWYSAATATAPGSRCPLNFSLRITARAWARTATWWLCSWTFSGAVLRIRAHRWMNRIREI